jgi:hypothetical protein
VENTQARTTPDWITTLPGYQPDQDFNVFEIAGAKWQQDGLDGGQYLYQSHPPLDPAFGVKRLLRLHSDGARFKWEAALWITESPLRAVKAHGESATLEGAAAAALAHRHDTKVVGGATFYADFLIGRQFYSALIGDELVEVEERFDSRREWSRAVDLTPFRVAGLCIPTTKLEGEAPTAMEAMFAAIDAPAAMRRACLGYLAANGAIVSEYRPRLRPMYRDNGATAGAH